MGYETLKYVRQVNLINMTMKSNVNFFKDSVQICIVVVCGVHLPWLGWMDYNNTVRLLLNLPRWCSVSDMFRLTSVPSFSVIMRRHKYSLLNQVICLLVL